MLLKNLQTNINYIRLTFFSRFVVLNLEDSSTLSLISNYKICAKNKS